MSALYVGHMAVGALLGVSPWIIPMIAVAAKDAQENARDAHDRARSALRRDDEASDASNGDATPDGGASPPMPMDERLRARAAATIWRE